MATARIEIAVDRAHVELFLVGIEVLLDLIHRLFDTADRVGTVDVVNQHQTNVTSLSGMATLASVSTVIRAMIQRRRRAQARDLA